jgi:hypothetical protein
MFVAGKNGRVIELLCEILAKVSVKISEECGRLEVRCILVSGDATL